MTPSPSATETAGQIALEGLIVGALLIVLASVVFGAFHQLQSQTIALAMAKTGTLSNLQHLSTLHFIQSIAFTKTNNAFVFTIDIEPDLSNAEKATLENPGERLRQHIQQQLLEDVAPLAYT